MKTVAILAGGVLLALAAIPLFGLAVFGLTFSGGPACWFAPHPDRFVQQVWTQANPESQCGTRYPMVDDLITNVLPGKTHVEVIALLGAPDDPDYGYKLGCWIDCDWVTIEYDANDRVARAYQSQD